jgi:hypothetical protein
MSMSDQDRAEIAEDLAAQGLDLTPDDVAATFDLYQRVTIPDDDPSPSPAMGADWRYQPQPGEEELFADTEDMFLPPHVTQEVGPTTSTEPLSPDEEPLTG